jgi:hypothetical protein
MKHMKFFCVAMCCLFLAACSKDDPTKPYLKIMGGGFSSSIASQIVTAVVVAKRLKPLPAGSVIEARFDLPQSTEPFVISLPGENPSGKYMFETEALNGLKKGMTLKVKLRLLDAPQGKELALFETSLTAEVDPTTAQ